MSSNYTGGMALLVKCDEALTFLRRLAATTSFTLTQVDELDCHIEVLARQSSRWLDRRGDSLTVDDFKVETLLDGGTIANLTHSSIPSYELTFESSPGNSWRTRSLFEWAMTRIDISVTVPHFPQSLFTSRRLVLIYVKNHVWHDNGISLEFDNMIMEQIIMHKEVVYGWNANYAGLYDRFNDRSEPDLSERDSGPTHYYSESLLFSLEDISAHVDTLEDAYEAGDIYHLKFLNEKCLIQGPYLYNHLVWMNRRVYLIDDITAIQRPDHCQFRDQASGGRIIRLSEGPLDLFRQKAHLRHKRAVQRILGLR